MYVMKETASVCYFSLDDDSRVCLSELPGVVGSDYINASFITVRIIQPCQVLLVYEYREMLGKK